MMTTTDIGTRAARRWSYRQQQMVWLLVGLLLSLPVFGAGAVAADTTSKEYQIKAACLFNFTQFVEWPATVFADGSTPIRIGVLGNDPFGTALDETVQGETVRNRHLEVVRGQRLEDLATCQLVFVSGSEKERVAEDLASLSKDAVLTVSDIKGFAGAGGVIGFVLDGRKVRFEINPGAARQQGLKISAQLLNLGRIVGQDPVVEEGR